MNTTVRLAKAERRNRVFTIDGLPVAPVLEVPSEYIYNMHALPSKG
jgi:hypothetical protein